MKLFSTSSLLCSFAAALALAGFGRGLAQAAEYDRRLVNLSTRAQVGVGANVMITGFVIGEGAPKKILVRAVGPGLIPYGVSGVLAAPVITLHDAAGATVATNAAWSAADAGIMNDVGAFPLAPGSSDAALVATLAPGSYTAMVRGASETSGVALLEVYDVSGPAKLINISTRATVSSGSGTLIAGLVIAPGDGTRRLLVRAAGPGLALFGVGDANPNPAFVVLDGQGRQVAANDDWGTVNINGSLVNAFREAGAFAFSDGSRDAALVADFSPGNYTIQVSGAAGGVALVEVYDISGADVVVPPPVVPQQPPVEEEPPPGPVTPPPGPVEPPPGPVTPPPGPVEPPPGPVEPPPGPVEPPPGEEEPPPGEEEPPPGEEEPPPGEEEPPPGEEEPPPAPEGGFFVAAMHPVPGTSGYGTVTVRLADDDKSGLLGLSFSNLSSPETSAHLVLDGNFILGLPRGQLGDFAWTIRAVGTYTAADIIAALRAGRITVRIDTSGHPNGELIGTFVRASGGLYVTPAAPPPVDLETVTPQSAARLLQQATFGPTSQEIEYVTQHGYRAWLDAQMALRPTKHRSALVADFSTHNVGGQGTMENGLYPFPGGVHRQAAWWKIAVNGQDQLRQRVAFALSEIFVVSDQDANLNTWQEPLAEYYDLLARNAFGNYRQLLEEVTLSPVMGVYLSSLRNGRGAVDPNGVAVSAPDENYAREVMQLFSIGLNELNPDGTLRLDANGRPIPTYDQDVIVQTAKVFTGWGFYSSDPNPGFRTSGGTVADDWMRPMMLYPEYHENDEKVIVTGKVLPAGQGGVADLRDLLDTLFNHPNTAPFVSRRLIQRLVTSNPSPGYVYRVAQVFADNGAGVRGDLGAVIRAILLDYEARSPDLTDSPSFGKLKEPILRATAFMRAFGAKSDSGRLNIDAYPAFAQAPLRSITVFNFFLPDYTRPGTLAASGLYAPEFQILTDTTAITGSNFHYFYIYNPKPGNPSPSNQESIYLTLDELIPLARNPAALVAKLNLILAAGSLSTITTDRIVSALAALPSNADDYERVRLALYLAVVSPEGAAQK